MKKDFLVMSCICFVSLAALFTVIFSVRAQAVGLFDIAGATIRFVDGDVYTYDGNIIEPQVRVQVKEEILILNSDYTLSYHSGKDKGEYFVTVTGVGSCTGTATRSYSIRPHELTDIHLRGDVSKIYDGTNTANVELTSTDFLANDDVKIVCDTAVYDNHFAGNAKDITVSGLKLTGAQSENYVIPKGLLDGETIKFEGAGTISAATPKVVTSQEVAAGGKRLDLMTLIEGGVYGNGYIHFRIPENNAAGCKMEEDGHTMISGPNPGTVKIETYILDYDINGDGADEYKNCVEYITVTITEAPKEPENQTPPPENTENPENTDNPTQDQPTDKKEQAVLSVTGPESITYGDSANLSTSGGSGGGQITYAITGGTGNGTIDRNGVFRATQVGTVWVTATKAGDSEYKDAHSDAKVITVNQATITVKVSNRTIRVGDVIPQLTDSDYTITGLANGDYMQKKPTLSYASTPNINRAGKVTIMASGGEVPTGGNYQPVIQYVQGTLTITEQPTYGITLLQPDHGTLVSDCKSATEGTVVNLTAIAHEGYALERPIVTYGKQEVSLMSLGGGKYYFTMPAGAVTVEVKINSLQPAETEIQTPPFFDVSTSDWFYNSVAYVYQKGLMNGTETGKFSPHSTTTRGMIVTILYRLTGNPAVTSYPEFSDVTTEDYYANPVVWANWNKIATGYDNGAFGPNDPVTRQQLAAILYRYAAYKNYNVTERGDLDQFSDKNAIMNYALQPISWANAVGLINGKGNGILDPSGYATRAEVAAILQRFCQNFAVFPEQ